MSDQGTSYRRGFSQRGFSRVQPTGVPTHAESYNTPSIYGYPLPGSFLSVQIVVPFDHHSTLAVSSAQLLGENVIETHDPNGSIDRTGVIKESIIQYTLIRGEGNG